MSHCHGNFTLGAGKQKKEKAKPKFCPTGHHMEPTGDAESNAKPRGWWSGRIKCPEQSEHKQLGLRIRDHVMAGNYLAEFKQVMFPTGTQIIFEVKSVSILKILYAK